MGYTRAELIADGEARIDRALAEVARVASMTKAELVTEAIHKAIFAIEIHRGTCESLPRHLELAPISNGDLIGTLRLRLRLLEELKEWSDYE